MLVLPDHTTVSVTVASLRSSLHFSLSPSLSLPPSYYQSLLSLHLPHPVVAVHRSSITTSSSLLFLLLLLLLLPLLPSPPTNTRIIISFILVSLCSPLDNWLPCAGPHVCCALLCHQYHHHHHLHYHCHYHPICEEGSLSSLCPLSPSLPLFLFRTLSPPPPPPRYHISIHIPINNIQPALF